MLGPSAAGEAGPALLASRRTAPQEDQENVEPGKASPAPQPRTRAGLAVLKAAGPRAPAPPHRPKTRRVGSGPRGGAGRGSAWGASLCRALASGARRSVPLGRLLPLPRPARRVVGGISLRIIELNRARQHDRSVPASAPFSWLLNPRHCSGT